MVNVEWEVKVFPELSKEDLFALLRLRVDVFVVEQKCAYPELDDYDLSPEIRHILGRDQSGNLVAYARVLPPGLYFSEVSLGRFVVRKEFRRKGIGHHLLQEALKEVQESWPEGAVRISAQDYLQNFYEQYGFLRVSDVYLEDGVPHIEMVRKC